jgi:hypothetical protein
MTPFLSAYKKLHGSLLASFSNAEPVSSPELLATFNSPLASVAIALINCNVRSSWPVGANTFAVPVTPIRPADAQFEPVNSNVAKVVFVLGLNVATTANAPSNVTSAKIGTVPISEDESVQFVVRDLQPVNIRLLATPIFGDWISGAIPLRVLPVHSISTPAPMDFSLPGSSTAAVVASALVPFSSVPLTIHPAVAADADADTSALSATTAMRVEVIIFALDITCVISFRSYEALPMGARAANSGRPIGPCRVLQR